MENKSYTNTKYFSLNVGEFIPSLVGLTMRESTRSANSRSARDIPSRTRPQSALRLNFAGN